jgi:hypothetical protein
VSLFVLSARPDTAEGSYALYEITFPPAFYGKALGIFKRLGDQAELSTVDRGSTYAIIDLSYWKGPLSN